MKTKNATFQQKAKKMPVFDTFSHFFALFYATSGAFQKFADPFLKFANPFFFAHLGQKKCPLKKKICVFQNSKTELPHIYSSSGFVFTPNMRF